MPATFRLDPHQPSSMYTDPGSSQPHKIIRLIDDQGCYAEVRVQADYPAVLDLHAALMAILQRAWRPE